MATISVSEGACATVSEAGPTAGPQVDLSTRRIDARRRDQRTDNRSGSCTDPPHGPHQVLVVLGSLLDLAPCDGLLARPVEVQGQQPGLIGLEIMSGGPRLNHKIGGLRNGTTYTFTVTANLVLGLASTTESQPSNPITPAGRPFKPVIGTAYPGDQSATVNWDPPPDDLTTGIPGNNGDPITRYDVQVGNVNPSWPHRHALIWPHLGAGGEGCSGCVRRSSCGSWWRGWCGAGSWRCRSR